MRRIRLVSLMLVLAGAYGCPAAPAPAATVEVVPEPADRGPWAGVEYRAASKEVNQVVLVTVDDSTVDVTDAGAVISPGRGCRSLDAHVARCSTAAFPGRLGVIGADVRAGDMDDVVESRGPGLSADGGPGDDRLESSSVVAGELDGGGGRDTLLGGSNEDTLIDGDVSGAADSDVLDGREGGGVVSYAGRTAPVRVDLARPGSAGEAGEGDVVRSVRGAVGGAGADELRGDGETNRLEGGPGADRLVGLGGDDFVTGGPGADRLSGGAGDDYLEAGTGRDTVTGGDGLDVLLEGPGRDRLRAGSGDDALFSGAGACGAGQDTITPSAGDFVSRDCEQARFSFPTRDADFKAVELEPHPQRVGRSAVTFRVRCPYTETDGYPSALQLRGSVRLTTPGGALVAVGRIPAAGRRCAGDEFSEDASELPRVRVRADLTAAGRRLLSRRRGTIVTVRFSGRNVPPVPWRIVLGG